MFSPWGPNKGVLGDRLLHTLLEGDKLIILIPTASHSPDSGFRESCEEALSLKDSRGRSIPAL